MKKYLFIISILFILISCNKEISDLQTNYFIRFYGDSLDDTGSDIEVTPEGDYVIAGTTTRPEGNTDIILIRTDKFGIQKLETVYYGSDADEQCFGLLLLSDGYVVTGSTIENEIPNFLLAKFNTLGELVWETSWDSPGQGSDLKLINNQIIATGFILSDIGVKRPMICSFDQQGNKIDLYAPTENPGDFFTSFESGNNFVFGFGTSFKNASNTDLFITGAATEPLFFELSGSNETSASIIKSNDGGFFIIGTSDPIGPGTNQIIVKKLNNDLTVNMSFNANPISAANDLKGVDICEMSDGTVAILGEITITKEKDIDIGLYFLNSDGTFRTSKTYGKTSNQTASAIKPTPDGGLIILGSNQQEKTSTTITLIKTDKEGNIWE